MKSGTSSCKTAALGKDLSRFWPVWVGYILWLLLLQIIQSGDDLSYWYAANMGECISVMGAVNLIFALVAAQMLFGDLFNPRMCNGLHSLPLKRTQWFSVHLTAGFLFSLIPTALTTLFSEWIICQYSDMVNGWQIPLYWFGAANLQYIFFFGLAVFCAMCAGSRFAMIVIYGILNFFSLLIYLLVDQLYTPLLQGVVTMSGPFELLCPVYQIVSNRCIDFERTPTGRTYLDAFGVEQREYIGTFSVTPEGWNYIYIVALIGIALLLLTRRMYQKRQLECAGDFLAVRWLEPVFQVVFTVLCAAAFHGMFLTFFGLNTDYVYILLAIGLTVGWFGGRMLLERSTRVFRLKNLAGFALVAVLMAGSLYVTHLDPLGIETWIPETDQVQSATLRMNYRNGYTTENPEEIEDFKRLHALALEQRIVPHPDYSDAYYSPYNNDPHSAQIILQYTSEKGWLSQRNYYVSAEGESGELMRKYCSRLDVLIPWGKVEDAEDLRHELRDTQVVTVHSQQIPAEFITDDFRNALADAIAADAESGNLIQSGAFHTSPIIEMEQEENSLYYLNLDIHGVEFWGSLSIYADCENILKVLEPTGVLDAVRQEYENIFG